MNNYPLLPKWEHNVCILWHRLTNRNYCKSLNWHSTYDIVIGHLDSTEQNPSVTTIYKTKSCEAICISFMYRRAAF